MALGQSWGEFYKDCTAMPRGLKLSKAERQALLPELLGVGFSQAVVADMLNVHRNTVTNDLKDVDLHNLVQVDPSKPIVGVDQRKYDPMNLKSASEAREARRAANHTPDAYGAHIGEPDATEEHYSAEAGEVVDHETGEIANIRICSLHLVWIC